MSGARYSTTTSSDMIADRRFAYGDAALKEGDHAAARDLFAQVIELVPHWPPAHFALATACLAAGAQEEARRHLEATRALDPQDRLGAALLLAQLEGKAAAGAMPDAFVATLFDAYAPRFDQHLVEALGYCAPERLAALLASHPAPPAARVFDLGCGTGLMARALPGQGAWQGVDLAPAMVAEAEKTGLYAALAVGELAAWLAAQPEASADLVLAADVFCYVPDLAPVFAQVHRVLRPGGRFAFSIQTHDAEGVIIGEDRRVHHAPALIKALAQDFTLLEEAPVSTRLDRGQPVPGALFLLRR